MGDICSVIAKKGLIGVLVALLLSALLAGCGNSGEEVAVRALVGSTMDEIAQRTGDGAAFEYMNDATREALAPYGIDGEALAQAALARMSYEVGDVRAGDEEATVSMTITNVSMDAAMERATERFATYSASPDSQTAYDEGGEAALMDTLFTYLTEELEAGELVSVTADLICNKVDGEWKILPENNAAFYAALYGTAQ